MLHRQHKQLNEKGFASIVIALVLIIVLALLTVGFAQLARREQQNALDKQLATQASDAAESGINNAYHDIQNNIITSAGGPGLTKASSTACMNPTGGQAAHSDIDPNHGVSYTCLLVNLTPPSLVKNLDPGTGWTTIFKVTDQNGGDKALRSFDVSWSTADGHTSLPPAGLQYPPIGTGSGKWGNAPAVLAFSITPLGSMDRASLINNTMTAYLTPSSTAGALTYPSGSLQTSANPYNDQQGQIVQAKCTAGSCRVTVNMSSGVGGGIGEEYLVHVINYYDSSQVAITNTFDTGGNPAFFANSQAIIDVTGKARQVLKRVQAHVPLRPTAPLPSYGLEAQDLCKRFTTTVDTLADGVTPGGTHDSQNPTGYSGTACSFN